MAQPSLPPEIILPTGQTGYLNPYKGTYTTKRDYAMRMQRGFAAGIPQQRARGRVLGEQTEYQQRAARLFERTGETPWQRFKRAREFKQQYGFELRYWEKLRRKWVDEINALSAPRGVTPGARIIDPQWVTDELDNARQNALILPLLGGSGKPWIERRLSENLNDMIQYRQGNSQPGALHFHTQPHATRPIEWWWYH